VPRERPKNLVNVADLEQERWIDLADAAGSAKSGLNVVTVGAGKLPAPAHCHSAEVEIFVVLVGDGTLELVPSPRARDRGHEEEHVPIRAGHVVARPAGRDPVRVPRRRQRDEGAHVRLAERQRYHLPPASNKIASRRR
jgi:mannose-6-phosphate isomerase-like protein (cupin superfamily)